MLDKIFMEKSDNGPHLSINEKNLQNLGRKRNN